MSPDRDSRFSSGDDPDDDLEDEEAPRSIFSATWFRVVLVVLGIGVVGAVAVPYVLDVVNPPESPAPRTAVAPAPSTTPSAPSPGASAPAAPTAKPSAPPASTAPSTSSPPSPGASAAKPSAPAPSTPPPAKPSEGASAPAAKMAAPKTPAADVAKKAPADKPATSATPRAAAPAKASEGGDYFVQVGAFREQATAKRVAAQLREQNYPVDESVKRLGDSPAAAPRPAARAATSGPDRYDVIVSGGSAAEINTRLAAKGLASEPAGDSVRIKPSLPLRDAVALSKDLGSEGFKVQVRRGGGASSSEPAPPAAPASDTGGQTLYRVRVGGYPDRAAAQAVLKELQDKGFQPFIAKGRE